MSFDQLIGNEAIKTYLTKAIDAKTVPHALIFSGIAGIGKSLFAKCLSASLLNTSIKKLETHPDFHSFFADSKSGLHSIDSLRLLIDEVNKVSFESSGKVFVIFDAHKMQTASANAILKTLEEPSPDTTIVLLTEHVNELLPTIRSRCAHIDFKPIEESLIASFLEKKGFDPKLSARAGGSIGNAIAVATKPPIEKVLFALLSQRLLYPDLLSKIEELETFVESDDPVVKNQNIEQMLITILMWFRDQHGQKTGIPKKRLFFPDELLTKNPLLPMEKLIPLIDKVRLGLQRNLKLSTCLESLFGSLTQVN